MLSRAMHGAAPDQIADELGCPRGAVSRVHTGENQTYRVAGASGDYALRLYRPGRRTALEIEAEWAWARAFQTAIRTPQAIVSAQGAVVRTLANRQAVAMTWIEGRAMALARRDDLLALGETLGRLQRRSLAVAADRPASWIGRHRPSIDPPRVVREAQTRLQLSGIMSSAQAERLEGLGQLLLERLADTPLQCDTFLHCDLHVGNLLATREGVVVLDFDDSLWGPREMEWAQPRLHLRAQGILQECWPLLAEASSLAPCLDRVRLATALYAIHTMGSFPAHLDMDAFTEPGAVVERYVGYIAAELS